MGLARIAPSPWRISAVAAICALLVGAPAHAGDTEEWLPSVLIADRDDDDRNGVADGEGETIARDAYDDLAPIDARLWGATIRITVGAELVRLVADSKVVAWGKPIPRGALLQGVAPGKVEGEIDRKGNIDKFALRVFEVGMKDGSNARVDLARSHASIERTPPERAEADPSAPYDDPDALRVVTTVPEGAPPLTKVVVQSFGANGTPLDRIELPLVRTACERSDAALECAGSAPLRLVVDDVDRIHPLVRNRSARAEVGGTITLADGKGQKLQRIHVEGPRRSPIGAIRAHIATIRPFVVRTRKGGPPPIGKTDAEAIQIVRTEIGSASAVWGQCGITFGPAQSLDVKVINPPPPHLLAFGDDLGVPASGGVLRARIDGRPFKLAIEAGWHPRRVAGIAAEAIRKMGFRVVVSENARITPGAEPSVDLSIRHADNTLAEVTSEQAPVCSDPSLTVRIGSVDFSDGLSHFSDMDSMAGTLEERTLIKSLDDGDARTIEVIVISDFSGGGRIGESFIGSDRSSVRNVVLMDRAGIGARRSSATLAHEIGHVILDVPGHPDDFGIDTPTRLMDSDAADASAFGPRRLTLDECAQAMRQSGPSGPLPLLRPGFSPEKEPRKEIGRR